MIQFIKFATLDPVGFALVKVSDVSSISSTPEPNVCKLITSHGDFLIEGSFEHHNDNLDNWVGICWPGVPEIANE